MSDDRQVRFKGKELGTFSIDELHRMAIKGEINHTAEFLSVREKRWMPLAGIISDLETSVPHAVRFREFWDHGIKRVRVLGVDSTDCPACQALQKTYSIEEVPLLPPANCTCVPWCRCLPVAAESGGDAKPATKKVNSILDPRANLRALVRAAVLVSVLLGGVWLFVRLAGGKKAADYVVSSVVRKPISLQDTIVDLRASAVKGLPIRLPYSGTLTIEIQVRSGNDISIALAPADQQPNIQANREFKTILGFEAERTRQYKRSGRVPSGVYYIVIRDKSLGILSQQSSDVSVKARLE